MDNTLPPSTPPEGGPASGGQPPTPPPLLPTPTRAPARARSGGRGWKIATFVFGGLLILFLLLSFAFFAQGLMPGPMSTGQRAGPRLQEGVLENNHSRNKILVIPIEGIISGDMISAGGYSLVDLIRDQLDLAAEDSNVKAVLLKVDSPGGEVLASDDIYRLIKEFQAKTQKPVVASMGSLAASGGYYISSPCRWIVANELTITGSIGVIFHSMNIRGLMDKVGIRPEVYKSGKYKDMMSWDKAENEITPQERKMMQDLIDETFQRFKTVVREGRQWANQANRGNKDDQGRALQPNWADYADGRVLSGKEAHRLGYVDELGNFQAAVRRTRTLAGIEDANLVKYQQIFNLSDFLHLFGKSEPAKLKVDMGVQMPKIKPGQLYFLAPTYVH